MKTGMAALCALLFCTACNLFDNYGYPDRVSFTAEGGSKSVKGGHGFYQISITDYNGGHGNSETTEEEGLSTTTRDWLTVSAPKGSSELTFTADPNPTGRSRKLYVAVWVDNSFADIKVTQQ